MRSAYIIGALLLASLAITPSARADSHFRAMVGGSAALTPGVDASQTDGGVALQGEAEVYGRFLGIYARGQHLGLVSNVEADLQTSPSDSVAGAATLEQSILVGPTLGFTTGPLRLRAAAGPVLISSNRLEGTAAEIQDGTATEVYHRATSVGGGAELRADLYLPILKPYAAVRGLATSADATTLSGGAYETLGAEDREALQASVGDRRRVEAVVGLRFSLIPLIQLGIEGSYGFMGDTELSNQPWYGAGLGLHFRI